MKARLHISLKMLVGAILGLLVLTGISWGISYLDLGAWSTAVALVFSTIKVMVVAVFFMELGEQGGALRLAALTIPLWIMTMILLMISDVATR